MNRFIRSLVALAIVATPAAAQKPAEDAKGESAVNLFERPLGVFTLNAGDKKIEFNWNTYSFNERNFWAAGVDASVKAENSVGSILKTGSVVPETEVGLRGAIRILRPKVPRDFTECIRRANGADSSVRDQRIKACERRYLDGMGSAHATWLFARASYSAAKNTLVTTSADFAGQVVKKEFSGVGGEVGLNGWRAVSGGTLIAGISTGLARTNNIDDLDDVVVRDNIGTFTDTSGVVRQISKKDVPGLKGDYKVFNEVPIKADLFLTRPGITNAGLWLFGRLSERHTEEDKESAGAGIFFFDKNPFVPNGSISVEWTNPGKWALNLVASLPIGFNLK